MPLSKVTVNGCAQKLNVCISQVAPNESHVLSPTAGVEKYRTETSDPGGSRGSWDNSGEGCALHLGIQCAG